MTPLITPPMKRAILPFNTATGYGPPSPQKDLARAHLV